MKRSISLLVTLLPILTLSTTINAETTVDISTEEHFATADTDDSKTLSFEEFKTFIALEAEDNIGRSRLIKKYRRYAKAFGTLDSDDNNLVTLEEINEFKARK